MHISEELKSWMIENLQIAADSVDAHFKRVLAKALYDGTITIEEVEELNSKAVERSRERVKSLVREVIDETKPAETLRQGRRSLMSQITNTNPNVRPESNKYRDSKRYLKHARTGMEIKINNRPVEEPSELSLAKAGVWAKNHLRKQLGITEPLPEHERNLLKEVASTSLFCGGNADTDQGWSDGRKLADYEVKTLLNDSTSGGENAVGVVIDFDRALITYPLLNGELFPMVDLHEATSDHTEALTVGNVSVLWNDSTDSTTATPFTTTDLIGKISTTNYPVSCTVLVGRDFLMDSAINVMQTLQGLIGEAMLTELDNVVANGSGSKPTGIFNASGTTAVSSTNGLGGPLNLSDAEYLFFGIPKQYRAQSLRTAFISNDRTYHRFRGMPIGSLDARRLFGEDYASYQMLGMPHKIQNDIADNQIAFAAMAKYRMYRRLGFDMRFSDQGKTLMLANQALLMVRSRMGGKPVDANAFAVMSNASTLN